MKPNDVSVQTVTKVAVFIILAFAIHLFLAGHHNPGGGFVGGLMVTSALTLLLLAFDVKTLQEGIPVNFEVLAAIGVLLAVCTGFSSVIFGQPFLNQTIIHIHLPVFGEVELAKAVIFDTGVALAVLGTALSIINTISEDLSKWKH